MAPASLQSDDDAVPPPAPRETGREAGPTLAEVPRIPRDRSAALVRATRAETLAARQAAVLGTLADVLDEPDLERALDALVAALHERFGCERASVALVGANGALRLGAVSQQGVVHATGAEARLLLDAMEEALLREEIARWPPADERIGTLVAHRALAAGGVRSVASAPLFHDAEAVGAVLLERGAGEPLDAASLELLGHVALAAAPLVALHRRADRGALARAGVGARRLLGSALGPERPGARALGAALAAALAGLALVPVEHRVTAEAELVPMARRLVSAPVAGFVDEVLVAAGDTVVAGQPLARLDRRELELEAARHASELAAARAEFRAALASHDRRATAIARAQLERARALEDIAERRLARSELRAPVAGTVIDAERTEAAGAPVERGDVLFEIAPGEDFEVHLLVDESDVRDVVAGQRGRLALRARPGRALALSVDSVHPVAESRDGASRFRVRASLADVGRSGAPDGAGSNGAAPRPGERGVARLDAGEMPALRALLRPLERRLAALWWRVAG